MGKLGKLNVVIGADVKPFKQAVGMVKKGLKGIGGAATGLPGIMAAGGAGFIAKELISVGDAYVNLDAQITDLTGSARDSAEIQELLFEMSQRTGTQALANAKAFTKLQMAQSMTGLTAEQNVEVLEGLNKIFALSGASATDTSIAMLQLGQALSSGKLQGDEFRSISEAAPGLLRALAKELGVATGELKKMGSDGKLTSEVLGTAFLNIANSGDLAFKEVPKTAARAFNTIINAGQRLWDHILDNTGLIDWLADSFRELGQWIVENEWMFIEWAQNAKQWIIEEWPEVKDQIIKSFGDMKVSIEEIGPVFSSVFVGGIEILKTVIPWLEKIINLIKMSISGWKSLINLSKDAWELSKIAGSKIPGITLLDKIPSIRGGGGEGGEGSGIGPGSGTIVNNINQSFSRQDLVQLNIDQRRQLARS